MKKYINEMKKCLKLAKIAQGNTSPNPLVGCVILNEKGKIVSTGCHIRYGEYHAERSALEKLDDAKGCTLIVNLEPCCHEGKTPPCTDIIIEKGIKRVVYGMKDPNPLVCGKGLEILKKSGIEIVGPVLEKECQKLNETFIKNKTENKTFVAIKTATTADGKIATHNGSSKWITSSKARNEVKYIRNKYDAILTSSATVISDNPTMAHKKKIILDRELKTKITSDIYKEGQIFVFHQEGIKPSNNVKNITYIQAPVKNNRFDIEFILDKLYELGIMSVIVEAGGKLNASFLPYADKIYQFIAPKILSDNKGISSFDGSKKVNNIDDCAKFKIEDVKMYSPDVLLVLSK